MTELPHPPAAGGTLRRVAVTGASGNVGTALLRRLTAAYPSVEVVGLCRRPPPAGDPVYDRVHWLATDLGDRSARAVLSEAFAGADAVVHLAWQVQPGRDMSRLHATNVQGSARVLDAATNAGVPHIVHMSSVGAYSPGPKDRAVDESWPVQGVRTSSYSRHKATVERMLDTYDRPDDSTVTRLRPGLIFQRDAASEVSRYFLGPAVPVSLLGLRRLPLLPVPNAAVFQAVHADDVADAVTRVLERRAEGPFNLAAAPVMTPEHLAEVFRARRVGLPERVVRAAAAATWRLHLQPTEPGWVDLALSAPVMAVDRARDVLGWVPRYDARAAVAELLDGMRTRAGTRSPVLVPRTATANRRA